MPDMTPDELKFFETGELPDSMKPADDGNPAKTPEELLAEEQAALAAADKPTPPGLDAYEMLQRNLQAETEARTRAEERARALETAAKPKDDPGPDPSTDPLGAMMHQINTVAKTLGTVQQQLVETQQQQAQQAQIAQFQNSIKDVAADFTKKVADYPDAYAHLKTVQIEDMRSLGFSEAQIRQALQQGEVNVAQNALRAGKNPAQVMYEMAKRHGYVPKAGGKDDGTGDGTSAAAKIAAIKKGTQAGGGPGKGANPPADVTLETLKTASNSDLDALVRDPKAWAKMTGGGSDDIFLQ
jgi:hypothetical protein